MDVQVKSTALAGTIKARSHHDIQRWSAMAAASPATRSLAHPSASSMTSSNSDSTSPEGCSRLTTMVDARVRATEPRYLTTVNVVALSRPAAASSRRCQGRWVELILDAGSRQQCTPHHITAKHPHRC